MQATMEHAAVRSRESIEAAAETIAAATGGTIRLEWDGERHLRIVPNCTEGELSVDSLADDLREAVAAELRRVAWFYDSLAGSLEFLGGGGESTFGVSPASLTNGGEP